MFLYQWSPFNEALTQMLSQIRESMRNIPTIPLAFLIPSTQTACQTAKHLSCVSKSLMFLLAATAAGSNCSGPVATSCCLVCRLHLAYGAHASHAPCTRRGVQLPQEQAACPAAISPMLAVHRFILQTCCMEFQSIVAQGKFQSKSSLLVGLGGAF